MRLEFRGNLERLYTDPGYRPKGYGPNLIRAYRKAVGLLKDADREAELRNFRGLNLEKLKGQREGQWSVRLDKQWRLILTFDKKSDGTVVVVIEIVDYH